MAREALIIPPSEAARLPSAARCGDSSPCLQVCCDVGRMGLGLALVWAGGAHGGTDRPCSAGQLQHGARAPYQSAGGGERTRNPDRYQPGDRLLRNGLGDGQSHPPLRGTLRPAFPPRLQPLQPRTGSPGSSPGTQPRRGRDQSGRRAGSVAAVPGRRAQQLRSALPRSPAAWRESPWSRAHGRADAPGPSRSRPTGGTHRSTTISPGAAANRPPGPGLGERHAAGRERWALPSRQGGGTLPGHE